MTSQRAPPPHRWRFCSCWSFSWRRCCWPLRPIRRPLTKSITSLPVTLISAPAIRAYRPSIRRWSTCGTRCRCCFLDPKLPLDHPTWQNAMTDDFGDAFLWQANFDRAVPIVLISRLPIAMLGAAARRGDLSLGDQSVRGQGRFAGLDALRLRSQPHRTVAAVHHRPRSGVDDDAGDVAHVGVAGKPIVAAT